MIGTSVFGWNRAIALPRPTFSQVLEELSVSEVKPVFPHSNSVFALGNNLVLRIPPGIALSDGCPVLSIALITVDDFFVGASVQTAALPPFTILGHMVPCSAQELLEHVRRCHPAPLSLGFIKNRWLLYYGEALALTFFAGENAEDPADSSLVHLEFYFQLPYRGTTTAAIVLP